MKKLSDAMKKLSRAIREGAKLRPQCTGDYTLTREIDGQIVDCTCALGAAFEAITGRLPLRDFLDDNDRVLRTIRRSTGLSWTIQVNLPAGDLQTHPLAATSILNDSGWTREQIADWLESQGL